MRASILVRGHSLEGHTSLTANQLQLDATVTHFAQEAANPIGIAAMLGGSLAYRISHLALSQWAVPNLTHMGLLGRWISQGGIKLASLTAEVGTFRSIAHPSDNLFSGPGFASDMLNFALLKTVGHYSRGMPMLSNHALQCSAMTAGHQLAYHSGLLDKPQGTLIQQFFNAEVMVLQMNAGLGLLHTFSGGKFAMAERRLDLEIRTVSSRTQNLRSTRNIDLLSTFRSEVTAERANPIEKNRGVIHDIRNLITAPAGFVEFVIIKIKAESSAEAGELRTQLTKIKDKSNRIARLIYECSEHHLSIEKGAPLSNPSDVVARHSDATLFALTESLQIAKRILVNYNQAARIVQSSEVLQTLLAGGQFGKLSGLLNKLHDGLLDQTNMLQGNQMPALVSLSDILTEAWFLSGHERKTSNIDTAEPVLPAEDSLLHINRYALTSSILNLLINAAHAMRSSTNRQLYLRGSSQRIGDENYVVIEVQDTGTGIAEEHQAHIFSPRFTTKAPAGRVSDSIEQPNGSGMGLFMVTEMLRQYGGKIELETSVGNGTLFRIRLKAFDPHHGLGEHLASAERPAQEGVTQVGRRYTQANLARADQEFMELAQLLHAEAEGFMSSGDKGIFLAGLAKHILTQHPYPHCQAHLIRLQRMIELAYARLDFEMVDAYRRTLDPQVEHYISTMINAANRVAAPESRLVPLEKMDLNLPGIYTVPLLDHLRVEHAGQFSAAGDRSVQETMALFAHEPEAIANSAQAFMNNFRLALHPLFTAIRLFELRYPERNRQELLTADFSEDPSIRTHQEAAKNALRNAGEFVRILRSPRSAYHEEFLNQIFQERGPNMQLEYDLLHRVVEDFQASSLEAFNLNSMPSRQELTSPLVDGQ